MHTAPEVREAAARESARASPRIKAVDRTQLLLRSVVVEQLIPEDHPACGIWACIGRLDLTAYTRQVRAVEGLPGARLSIRSYW